ncbi:BZIP transcription factor, putative (DUF630 and DUF632) [Quillaja saponaria]|uniref:BZIP transcription factor, putative (DUF630 and DUF632) n=1 Tax=Quillaja saponaria TaxID=32244 RepID=A0AAD7PJ54_QUISA|nr:BZIP transcription factor, putative (DUF630 and DUF632) [Quillaja saponaria]
MGCANSKSEKNEALRLCRERKRFIKQAIDSRRYAEAEVLIELSQSISDKTPSHSSYPSPSPSHVAEVSDSPLHNESPLSPPMATLSYMRSEGSTAVTVKVNPCNNSFIEEDSMAIQMPPPPPPPGFGSSWDFFDPCDESESFRFVGHNGFDTSFDNAEQWKQLKGECNDGSAIAAARGKWAKVGLNASNEQYGESVRPKLEQGDTLNSSNAAAQSNTSSQSASLKDQSSGGQVYHQAIDHSENNTKRLSETLTGKAAIEQTSSKRDKTPAGKNACTEREDPSEFITHRAKDFLSSIKDIEHRFLRASEAGREVSRMLEANKINVGYSEAKGKSSTLALFSAFQLACCGGKTTLVSNEPSQHATEVITWKRTASSQSSSSRNALAATSKEDIDDSGSDFIEEFCMIAGSHSSTLDRMYAWERKLYDEVKASEYVRKEYDRKCDQLRHQFAKDQSAQVIDKTRSAVKDLHSRIKVAIHSVDSISKRIERMRDEELHPQLVELTQGLVRMWKAMLECHHAQYITISLAYHSSSSTGTLPGDIHREILNQLQQEIECFGLSFARWINSHASYVGALNGWQQNCITQPQERSKNRRPFSPRRALAPPIFVLCRDWSAGIKALPSDELSHAIKSFLSDLHHLIEQRAEQIQKKQNSADEKNDEDKDSDSANLCCIHTSLTKVLDRLTKFSEASLKMYEDIRQKSEAARTAYLNSRPREFKAVT